MLGHDRSILGYLGVPTVKGVAVSLSVTAQLSVGVHCVRDNTWNIQNSVGRCFESIIATKSLPIWVVLVGHISRISWVIACNTLIALVVKLTVIRVLSSASRQQRAVYARGTLIIVKLV
jgi:hypothetical protein